jgi:quercetin dioxygenase-like cupin family protein
MKPPKFPEFIHNLPEADLPVVGIRGWLVQSENGQVLFLQADQQVRIPQHHHGDQWGIVIDGEMELTIGEKTDFYHQGDSYFIPAGVMHGAILYKGFRALDYFADKDRYKTKV